MKYSGKHYIILLYDGMNRGENMNINEFIEALEKKGIFLTKQMLEQFELYFEMLVSWNEKMNLTNITQKEDVYLKHFYDSLSLAFDHPLTDESIADIGAGAGFPSIPLKIAFPNIKVTIVDSLNKRITFLNALIEALGLENVEAIASRAEDYAKDHRESFDIVSARAVARLNILDELCLPLVKVGGYFISLKGSQGEVEWMEAKNGVSILGGKLENMVSFKLLKTEDQRVNLYIRKVKPTPNKYPRPFAKMKKAPLK